MTGAAVIVQAQELLAGLAEPASRSDTEVMESLTALRTVGQLIGALTLRELREAEGRSLPSSVGAAHAVPWAADMLKVSKATVHRMRRLDRALPAAPVIADAYTAGRLSAEQARLDGSNLVRIEGYLDVVAGASFLAAIDALCAPRNRTALGVGFVEGEADLRTAGQRRHDAVCEIGNRVQATGTLPDHGGDRPQAVVTVGLDTLVQETGGLGFLDDGTPLTPGECRKAGPTGARGHSPAWCGSVGVLGLAARTGCFRR